MDRDPSQRARRERACQGVGDDDRKNLAACPCQMAEVSGTGILQSPASHGATLSYR